MSRRGGKKENKNDVDGKSITHFTGKGFDALNKPDAELPEMKIKISDISSNDLGDFTALYSAWREYAEDLQIRALARQTITTEEYDYERSLVLLATDGKTVKEREAKVDTTKEIYDKRKKLIEIQLYCEALAGKLESLNNILTVLSREVSRRSNYNA